MRTRRTARWVCGERAGRTGSPGEVDAATGACFLIDLSAHGTTVDGQPVPRGYEDGDGGKRENGVEAALPPRARIGLAGRIFLDFARLP